MTADSDTPSPGKESAKGTAAERTLAVDGGDGWEQLGRRKMYLDLVTALDDVDATIRPLAKGIDNGEEVTVQDLLDCREVLMKLQSRVEEDLTRLTVGEEPYIGALDHVPRGVFAQHLGLTMDQANEAARRAEHNDS